MIYIILIIIFIILSGICKAIADTLKDHFFTSVFKNRKQSFWNPEESWKQGYLFGRFHGDAWHYANSLMILFFLSAISTAFLIKLSLSIYLFYLVGIIGGGIIFVLTFNLFYNKLLIKK